MDAERPTRAAYRFDRFTPNLARGALLAEDGTELPLWPKSFALLRLLVENAGRLLDPDAVTAAVWRDVFVTDGSIAQCVRDIGRAIGDEMGRLLRTVPRRGYLLAAEVSLAGPDGPPRPSADPPTGQAVAASRIERRLAAILVADVVDYSRLVGRDEAGTLARLKACRRELLEPSVARYRGRIVNFPGDNMLCEFASAVDAVECALAVQTAAAERDPEAPPDRRIVLRIGVHAGDVVSDETGEVYGDTVNIAARLEQLAEPGGVCVSDRVHEELAGRVDTGFEHGGEPPLKNIARAVGVWFWPPSDRSGRAPRLLPPADKPSIAVLPFDNLGGGTDDTALADGMVEDLTTALARLNWLFVVARTSAFALRGQAVDAREAGRRLGVRYLLEGSVRRAGKRVRVTGQLIDATSGAHVWADHFDGSLDDILDLQDEIVASTVGAIEPNVLRAEIERARLTRPEDMRAHHYYLRAVGLMGAALTNPEGSALDEARALLALAIELDPAYAPALALAGYYEIKAIAFGRNADIAAGNRRALELVERAVQADPNDPLALGTYGFVRANVAGDLARAAAFADRALALNQNSPLLWNFAGEARAYLGEHDRAIECFHRSMRLNPLDPRTITNAAYLAFAYLLLRQLEEAVRWAERAVLVARNPLSYRILAASLAEAGRIDEARAAMAELLRLQPNSCLRRSRAAPYKRPEDVEFYVEALRKAGAPEEPTGELASPEPDRPLTQLLDVPGRPASPTTATNA